MTVNELAALFEKHEDQYLEHDKVSGRRDLFAFNLLDKLVPGTADIVSAAEHDEIFLDTSAEQLALVVTEEQVIQLTQCGVRYHSKYDCLAMFA